jgi:hypothetical protein
MNFQLIKFYKENCIHLHFLYFYHRIIIFLFLAHLHIQFRIIHFKKVESIHHMNNFERKFKFYTKNIHHDRLSFHLSIIRIHVLYYLHIKLNMNFLAMALSIHHMSSFGRKSIFYMKMNIRHEILYFHHHTVRHPVLFNPHRKLSIIH